MTHGHDYVKHRPWLWGGAALLLEPVLLFIVAAEVLAVACFA